MRWSGAIGAALGLVCAANDQAGQWTNPTPEECLVSGTVSGVGIGLLIGAWPQQSVSTNRAAPAGPGTAARTDTGTRERGPLGIGVAVPVRLPAP